MIRANYPVNLHLARHAEAVKNIENRHGGGEQTLTPRGIAQARGIGNYLLRVLGVREGEIVVSHQPEGRSQQTAAVANEVLLGKMCMLEDVSGIGLGERAGLSEEEMSRRYPHIAQALIEWRTGKTGLQIPELPGTEPMESFAERILRGMNAGIEQCDNKSTLLLVGTTSTLVMANHLLVHDGEFDITDYNFYGAPLGALATWRISDRPPEQLGKIVVPGEV